jgi:hypothetical protein
MAVSVTSRQRFWPRFLHDDITEQIATKEHVDLVIDRASERLEKMIHLESRSTIKWVAGMMVVQTVAILTGTVGLVKLLL